MQFTFKPKVSAPTVPAATPVPVPPVPTPTLNDTTTQPLLVPQPVATQQPSVTKVPSVEPVPVPVPTVKVPTQESKLQVEGKRPDLLSKFFKPKQEQVQAALIADREVQAKATSKKLATEKLAARVAIKVTDTQEAVHAANIQLKSQQRLVQTRAATLDLSKFLKKIEPSFKPEQDQARQVATAIQELKLELPDSKQAQEAAGLLPEETSGRVEKSAITRDLLNDEQRQAVDMATAGKSFCLIGSAGTGKTTTQRVLISELLLSGQLKYVPDDWEHRVLPKGIKSIAVLSYQNRAVNNIRSALPSEFKSNACTIHKFLEYSPCKEEREKLDESGNTYMEEVQVFKPRRNATNQIKGLTHIIVEESTTCSLELWEQLLDALPNRGADIVFILLGDIKQLPPIFDISVLQDRLPSMLASNVACELTKIYRTSEESAIKRFAIEINEGVAISDVDLKTKYQRAGELEFVNLSGFTTDGKKLKRTEGRLLAPRLANTFIKLLATDRFIPFRDVILCPRRVNNDNGVNCEHLNMLLADAEGRRRNAEVFEILAGFATKYLAVGDPVVMDKKEYWITNIKPNPNFKGFPPRPSSTSLDRRGHYHGAESELLQLGEAKHLEELLNIKLANIDKVKDEKEAPSSRAASHVITLESVDSDPELSGIEIEVGTAGDVGSIDWAYATTVHKSIGSEWDRVFLVIHHSAANMMFRELLYTAVTRAKLYLQVLYDGKPHDSFKETDSMISKAICNPKIKGRTLAEKVAWITSEKAKAEEDVTSVMKKFEHLKVNLPTEFIKK